MNSESWLSIFEYSSRHGLSISTLRRRIKQGDIKYKLDKGKYFVLENAPVAVEKPVTVVREERPEMKTAAHELTLSSAQSLLTELKRAYTQILHEKEEQIKLLKEEIADLKTLVRVLERPSF